MATGTHTGTNYAVANAPTPATLLNAGQWGGKVRVLEDKITVGAAADSGSILKVGKLPKGAIPLVTFLKYSGSATTTFAIGSSDDTDMLGVFTAVGTTPSQYALPTTGSSTYGGANIPLVADTVIEMLAAAQAMTSGDVFDIKILYATE